MFISFTRASEECLVPVEAINVLNFLKAKVESFVIKELCDVITKKLNPK